MPIAMVVMGFWLCIAAINGERIMRFLILIISILLVTTHFSFAQDQQKEIGITYDALVSKLDKHPALDAVRQQVILQQEESSGAGGLPDPMLMFGINNYPADGSGGFDRFAMTSKSIGFVQKIPNGGGRTASVTAKRVLAAKAQIAVLFTKQRLIAELNTALAEQKRVAHQQSLQYQDINLLKQVAAYWDGRLQAGDSTLGERSRVQADLAQAEAKLATLKAEEIQFNEELKRLVAYVGSIDFPDFFATPWPNTNAVYPVLMAEKDVQVARASVEGAKSAFKPNYQVGMTYSQRDDTRSFDGGDFVSAQIGISIPLWASSNQAPKLRSANASVSRAQAILADTESRWQQQLATQFAKIKETKATQKALHEKEKSIQTQISSLRGAYESDGKLDMLIAAKRSLLGLKLQLAELDARYVKQVSNYNAVFQKTTTVATKKAVTANSLQYSKSQKEDIQIVQTGGNL